MTLLGAAGLFFLISAGTPGCSPDSGPQAPSFTLPPPAFPEIVAAAARNPSGALTQLDEAIAARGASPEALVLRARLLGDVGKHLEAAEAWEAVAQREPSLASYARRASLRAAIAAGNADRARVALAQLNASGARTDHTDLALIVATRLRTDGRHDDARALYRDVLAAHASGSRWEEARLGLGESLIASGDVAAAASEFRRVRLGFATYEAYLAARRREEYLKRESGGAPQFTESEYRALIDRLVTRSRYDEAVVLYEAWQRDDAAEVPRLEAAIIDTLYRARDNAKARDRIRKFRSRWPGSTYDDELTVLDFRIAIREARTADVRALGYRIMRGQVPGVSSADERGIGRLVGSYFAAVGELTESLAVFRELFQSSRSSEEQADLLWRSGITALRAGDAARAKSNLEGLLSRNPGAETARIARFWIADAEQRLGNKAGADQIWARLADEQPLDYYGLRAADRIGRTDRLASAPGAPDLTTRGDTLASPEMKAARLLASAGMPADAAAFTRQAAERFPADLGIAYEAARVSAAAGEFRAAHSLMARRFPSYMARGGRGLPPDFLKLFWPMAFEAQITAAATRAGVDPLVMLAIARRESRYDPGVRSLVGAIGLFQFMPYTARELAPAAGLADTEEATLKTPDAAARLAGVYLKELLRRFDGELAPAAASYNAGEDLATVWWKAHKSAGVDMFVEMIPYAETRGYVREVVANHETYVWLYR
ncbi:MAG: lytic transglycosylase domain-containing protein [Acidobacteriota bacterium]|nr:lytic transglycosylase domain-containing protein [Acidobacteriota bacterium]